MRAVIGLGNDKLREQVFRSSAASGRAAVSGEAVTHSPGKGRLLPQTENEELLLRAEEAWGT